MRRPMTLTSIYALAVLSAAAEGGSGAASGASPPGTDAPAGDLSAAASSTAPPPPAEPTKPPEETKPARKSRRAAGADRTAPIPDAVADGVQVAEDEPGKEAKEIPDLAALGKAFVKNIPDSARSGSFRPTADDKWMTQPVGLPDGWHHDEGTAWNFLIRDRRLFEAKSDAAMANQPSGTNGYSQRQ